MSAAKHERIWNAGAAISPLAWPRPVEGPAAADGLSRAADGRVLIGGVGYSNLRDRSFGPLAIERLAQAAWPADVLVEDLSYGPIDVLFKLQAEPRPVRLAILFGAVARGRSPGAIARYRWEHVTPAADELQTRIGEAYMGVVSLDNLLYILDHFGALPPRTVVIEIEPAAEESWGTEFSPAVAAALECIERLVRDELAAARAEDGR